MSVQKQIVLKTKKGRVLIDLQNIVILFIDISYHQWGLLSTAIAVCLSELQFAIAWF